MSKGRKSLLAALITADLSLVGVVSGVQLSSIPHWTLQQWVLAVMLPLAALAAQVTGGLAAWWWARRHHVHFGHGRGL
jgi:hypothetical protein